jgi:hypothetical protein
LPCYEDSVIIYIYQAFEIGTDLVGKVGELEEEYSPSNLRTVSDYFGDK